MANNNVRTITNDKLYDALNSMRLELKGDIRDLRNQFDTLEAGRLTRLEAKMGDFEVTQAKRNNLVDRNQAVLSTKVLVMWGIAGSVFVVISEVLVNRLTK